MGTYSKKLFLAGLSILLSVGTVLRGLGQQIAPFKDGDRVVFLGNSITDGGHYHAYIWLYYLTRFPGLKLQFFNAGIGGDRVVEMLRRLDGDVFSKKPTVLITTFGMNDSGYFEYNGAEPQVFADTKVRESHEAFKDMEKRYKQLVGTRLVLLGSTPYDETVQIKDNTPFKNKNKAMQRIVDFQRESARANGWEFFDFNEPITAINVQGQQKDPGFTISGSDRVHPDNNGHMVMAYLFLKAQGFAGREVATVTVDAARQRVEQASNCRVDGLRRSAAALEFDYLAAALPYPLDTTARGWGARYSQHDAVGIVPFMEEMNRETLQVKGLRGDQVLWIDDEQIGTWSAADLTKGINLAAQTRTPQYQQALKVMYLNEERWEIERRFRDLAWVQYNFFQPRGLLNADNRKAIEVMDQHVANDGWLRAKRDLYAKAMHPEVRAAWQSQIEDLQRRMNEVNQPVKHRIRLVPAKK